MLDALFVFFLILYFALAAKVDEWITITRLGFSIETPQGFMDHPRWYDAIRSLFFLAAGAVLYDTRFIPWYIGLGILAIVWLAAGWVGQGRAFETYRKMWRDAPLDPETPADKAFREAESSKADAELRARL